MSKVAKNCEVCGKEMLVRTADVKRGWGRFCSKTCKAREQERRTHQYAGYVRNGGVPTDFETPFFDNTEHQDHERK